MFDHRLDVILEADGPTRRDFLQRSAAAVSVGPTALVGVVDSLVGFKSLSALANRAWLNSSVFKHLSRMSKSTREDMYSNKVYDSSIIGNPALNGLSPEDRYAFRTAVSWQMLDSAGNLKTSVPVGASNIFMNIYGFIDLMIKEAGGSKQFLRLFCNDFLRFMKDRQEFGNFNPASVDGKFLDSLIWNFKINPSLKTLLVGFDGRILWDPKISLWQAQSKFIDVMHKNNILNDAEYHSILQTIKTDSMDPALVSHDVARRNELKRTKDDWYNWRKQQEDIKRTRQREKERRKDQIVKKDLEYDRNAISRWEDEGGALPKDLEESINNLLSIII